MSALTGSRAIVHLDMDAFYPAVEVLDNPGLKGKPVIVGGSRERGVVSSASYEARRFGIHSAQPIARAMRLCPEGIFLRGRMDRYREVSALIFRIFRRFTPLVEPLSIDEAFLDVTGSRRIFGGAVEIARRIKETVLDETGLTVSAGIGPSKFVAKIASDMDKPDGLTVVDPDRVTEFLDPLPIGRMWGVGRVTQEALSLLDIHTFRDLRLFRRDILEGRFGENGLRMHLLSMGIDERPVVPGHEAKSVGHEQTFMEDIVDLDTARKEILALSTKVAQRVRREGLVGRTVSLKVKYSDFKQITRAKTLPAPTDDGFEIYGVACGLLQRSGVGRRPARLLGVTLSQLGPAGSEAQLSLFGNGKRPLKRTKLNRALDSIAGKHGEKSIGPAALF